MSELGVHMAVDVDKARLKQRENDARAYIHRNALDAEDEMYLLDVFGLNEETAVPTKRSKR